VSNPDTVYLVAAVEEGVRPETGKPKTMVVDGAKSRQGALSLFMEKNPKLKPISVASLSEIEGTVKSIRKVLAGERVEDLELLRAAV
jgi:hypothetical protein